MNTSTYTPIQGQPIFGNNQPTTNVFGFHHLSAAEIQQQQALAEQQAAEQQALAEQQAAEQQALAEQRLQQQQLLQQQERAAEQRAAEQQAAEQRAAEQRAAEQQLLEQHQDQYDERNYYIEFDEVDCWYQQGQPMNTEWYDCDDDSNADHDFSGQYPDADSWRH